jgi:hypothetical protein
MGFLSEIIADAFRRPAPQSMAEPLVREEVLSASESDASPVRSGASASSTVERGGNAESLSEKGITSQKETVQVHLEEQRVDAPRGDVPGSLEQREHPVHAIESEETIQVHLEEQRVDVPRRNVPGPLEQREHPVHAVESEVSAPLRRGSAQASPEVSSTEQAIEGTGEAAAYSPVQVFAPASPGMLRPSPGSFSRNVRQAVPPSQMAGPLGVEPGVTSGEGNDNDPRGDEAEPVDGDGPLESRVVGKAHPREAGAALGQPATSTRRSPGSSSRHQGQAGPSPLLEDSLGARTEVAAGEVGHTRSGRERAEPVERDSSSERQVAGEANSPGRGAAQMPLGTFVPPQPSRRDRAERATATRAAAASLPGVRAAAAESRAPALPPRSNPSEPRVHIGQVHVLISAPAPEPRPSAPSPASNLLNRHYLRST